MESFLHIFFNFYIPDKNRNGILRIYKWYLYSCAGKEKEEKSCFVDYSGVL